MHKVLAVLQESMREKPTTHIFKPGCIRQKEIKCAVCGKKFSIQNGQINYFYNRDTSISFVCDKCYQSYLDHYTVVDVERIEPNPGFVGGGKLFGLRTKDGDVRDTTWGSDMSQYGEIPKIFHETLAPFKQKYFDEVNAKKIKDISVEDTWEKQVIHVEFNSGKKVDINFKVGTNGLLKYNPHDVEKLTDDEVRRINDELKERYFNHKI